MKKNKTTHKIKVCHSTDFHGIECLEEGDNYGFEGCYNDDINHPEEQKIILECIYHTNSMTNAINKYKEEFKRLINQDKNLKQKLVDNFYHLKNAIQFGLNIKLK